MPNPLLEKLKYYELDFNKNKWGKKCPRCKEELNMGNRKTYSEEDFAIILFCHRCNFYHELRQEPNH